MNVSVVDAVENLTPKSSITAIRAYGIVHFLGRDPETNTAFIGSDQTTAEVGYDRIFGPHDQGAIIYVYEGFDFSVGINFHSNIIQLMWGHRISGRMDFLISAGPQFTQIDNIPTPVTGTLTQADTSRLVPFPQVFSWNVRPMIFVAAQAGLRYATVFRKPAWISRISIT